MFCSDYNLLIISLIRILSAIDVYLGFDMLIGTELEPSVIDEEIMIMLPNIRQDSISISVGQKIDLSTSDKKVTEVCDWLIELFKFRRIDYVKK